MVVFAYHRPKTKESGEETPSPDSLLPTTLAGMDCTALVFPRVECVGLIGQAAAKGFAERL